MIILADAGFPRFRSSRLEVFQSGMAPALGPLRRRDFRIMAISLVRPCARICARMSLFLLVIRGVLRFREN